MSNVDIGTGTTLTFGTSGFVLELLDVNLPGIIRNSIDTSHMGTPVAGSGKIGSMTFIPSKLVDPGEISVDWHFDPDKIPPIESPTELLTVTFPLAAGFAVPATWVASGFMTAFDPTIPLEDKMVVTSVLKLSGSYTINAATT